MQEQENTKERDLKPNSVKGGGKRILNYQSIVKQVPFFLFLALLAVIYIYNGHYADKTIRNIHQTTRAVIELQYAHKTIRKINQTAKAVKELQYEYKTGKSEVMFRSKQSELARAVEPLGLKELTIAPVVLKDTIR